MATLGSTRGTDIPNIDNAPNRFLATPDKYTALNDLILDSGSFGDNINKPEVRELLIQAYGDQGITGFLKLTGATTTAGSSDQVHWFEAGRRHKTLFANDTMTSWSSGVAQTAIYFAGDGASADADTYQPEKYDVLMKVADGAKFVVTNDAAGAILSSLDGNTYNTNVDDNDEFVLLGNMYPQGSDQPGRFTQPEVKRYDNTFAIVKDRY